MLERLALYTTYRCNLRCSYCYVMGSDNRLVEQDMTEEMAKNVFDHFIKHFDNIEQIFFYGGEPLLALNVVKSLCEHINQMFHNGNIIEIPRFVIITNGTLITNEFLKFAKKYNVGIIVSIDGPPSIHDLHRRSALDCGTAKDVLIGIRKLKADGLPFGIECTYTPDHLKRGYLPLDVYRYLYHLGARDISLIEVGLPYPDNGLFNPEIFDVYLDAYIDFLRTVIEESRPGDKPTYTGLATMLEAMIKRPEYLEEYFCEAGINTFAVNPMGDTYPCHMLIDQPNFYLGQYSQVTQPVEILPKKSYFNKCVDCTVKNLCQACPFRMYTASKSGLIEPIPENCRLISATANLTCNSLVKGDFGKSCERRNAKNSRMAIHW